MSIELLEFLADAHYFLLLEISVEFFEFNVKGSELGDKTPIWCEDMLIE